ncbi:WecB/TagA/CpsF family glycosyltransferase [Pseudomonas sp. gcc21]|uniref:WecB/TagA/CpsF family glycosyltransferase n=1 Tax=Pseudomonas sp. gcc21 TaxID=2726989 RepID=UPI001451CEF9|nr:WecB/TagA/CpsF family glycosyltransferase [Pseudomonas sp. gcc21]QJD60215.1 WecB/TagA/CpsF family glycosyltransferase [Pseudomonas sp. gcc21]
MTNSLLKRHDPLINKLLLIDESQSDALLQKLAAIDSPTTLAFLNQHAYNLAQQNLPMRRRFAQMSYLLRDGIGVKIACKLNGRAPRANMNGSDFIPKVIDYLIRTDADRYQFFALGTREPWLSKGARRLFQGHPFHAMDGFQPEESYAQYVERHCESNKVPVIVLAMGMPKQEEVAIRIKRELDMPALLICGGAILDFSAERFTRAPLIFRKTGLEWAYRLGKEPKRLFKRYVIGIPKFFYYVGRNGFGSAPRDPKHHLIE